MVVVACTNGDGRRTTAASAGTWWAGVGAGRAVVTGGLCGVWTLMAAGRAGACTNGDDSRTTASSAGAGGLLLGLGAV